MTARFGTRLKLYRLRCKVLDFTCWAFRMSEKMTMRVGIRVWGRKGARFRKQALAPGGMHMGFEVRGVYLRFFSVNVQTQ